MTFANPKNRTMIGLALLLSVCTSTLLGAANEPAPKPDQPTAWQKVTSWQQLYDIKSGKTIFIRKSTDEPDPKGATIILRWRKPAEIADRRTLSGKAAERFHTEQQAKKKNAAPAAKPATHL